MSSWLRGSPAIRVGWCCLFAAGALPGQTTGTLEGTVLDPSGAVIAGASVRILETQTSVERGLRSDRMGRYLAPALPPGAYEIEVSHPGFRNQLRQALELDAGSAARVDFHLKLGEARHTVIVVEAPLLSTRTADWGRSVDRQNLDHLPLNGRDMFDLTSQEPGAVVPATAAKRITTGLGVHLSVNGARPSQNSFRMDGIYINDATGSAPASASGKLLGLEGIRELRLVTSPFSAEYGRAAGAVLTAVSKSGTNDLHGSLYEFLRNSAFDARNFFDVPGETIPPLRKNQFGGLLSGPLRRNRLFFLVNYEGIREARSRTERPATLSAAARQGALPDRAVTVASAVLPYLELYPLPNARDFGDGTAEFVSETSTVTREDYVAGKADAILSDRLRFSSRYTLDNGASSVPDPFQIWRFMNDSRYQFLHTEAQYLQSPATIHSFRAGFSRVRSSEDAVVRAGIPASLSFVKGQPLGSIRVTGLADLGALEARLRPRRNVLNDFQFSDDVLHIRGAHSFHIGGGYDRVHYNGVADINAGGFYRFDSLTDFLQARPRAVDVMAPGSDSIRGWRQHQFSAFAQDDYRAGRRLTIALGVRYEAYSTPAEVNGKIATLPDFLHDSTVTIGGPLFRNPSKWNFAPRAAIAWDPLGSGNTVVRAGAGIFLDLLGVREVVVAGVRVPPFFNRLLVSRPGFPNALDAAQQVNPPKSLDGLDYQINQPYVGQFQFSIEQRLGPETGGCPVGS